MTTEIRRIDDAGAPAVFTDPRGRDLADLTETEFAAGLERVRTVRKRVDQILDAALVLGAHYGNPKATNGKEAFKKPILFKAGAEELRRLMRYALRRTEADAIEAREDYVAVIVTLAIFDGSGRLVVERRGACNSKEKRFRTFDGKSWIYQDAREMLHNCLAMAEKRAAVQCTLEACGVTAFLANGEELEDAEPDERPVAAWTPEEKAAFYKAAGAKGMTRADCTALVRATLGRDMVGTGDDAAKLIAAVATWSKPTAEAAA